MFACNFKLFSESRLWECRVFAVFAFPQPAMASVRDTLCSSQSLPKLAKAFQKLPKAFQNQNLQSMTKPSKASKTSQSSKSLSKPFKITLSLTKPPKAFQNLAKHPETSHSISRVSKSVCLGVHMSDSSSTAKQPAFYSKMLPKMNPQTTTFGCVC